MTERAPSVEGAGQLVWAREIFRALAAAGVRDVVVSPGSRSTPFVLGALAIGDLTVRDVIDERSAAFFALGQARASGRPSVCLATSGTAGAHYLPAVIEAGLAHVPLIVLTADRPLELQGCGALQTIDQPRLFGHHARAFFELGGFDPAGGALAVRAAQRMAAQAVLAATHPLPGAVHLNARARKPLEAPFALEDVGRAAVSRAARPRLVPSDGAIAELSSICSRSARGVIVLGPDAARDAAARLAIVEVARSTRFPIFAEATSGLRFVDPRLLEGVTLLDTFDVLPSDPELVLLFGMTPTSAAVERCSSAARVVISPYAWNDPSSSAELVILADPAELRVDRTPHDDTWRRACDRANATARAKIRAELDREGDLSEGFVARETVRLAPPGSTLFTGNGLAIRHLDRYVEPALADLHILAQRGASGIDGLVSGAAGAASVTRAPLALLLGDVSMLHDLGGLAAAASIDTPFPIAVIHNDGGRIFESLPLAKLPGAERVLDHFITPHGRSFAGAAAMFGIPHVRAETRARFTEALARAHETRGPTLIEAITRKDR